MSKVKVINTRTMVPVVLETDAVDWGELKDDILDIASFDGFDFKTARIIIRANGTKYTVSLDEEQLPAADSFTVFLTPIKVDQGNELPYSKSKLREVRTILATIDKWISELIEEENLPEAAASRAPEISDEEREFIESELR